jgi:uncharacterized protein (DUF1330 family)
VTNTPSRPAARSSIDGLTEDEQVPKGYVILTEAIRDRAGIDACGAASMTSLLEHGARVLVADENVEVLEGEWQGNRTVVVEYESVRRRASGTSRRVTEARCPSDKQRAIATW